MIYLPNSYHSKPKLPSHCQMDPASICCLQCFFLRLLLSHGMNESNPRELVLVKMLRYKCKRYKMRLEFLSLECPSLIKNAETLCQASPTPSMVPPPPRGSLAHRLGCFQFLNSYLTLSFCNTLKK